MTNTTNKTLPETLIEAIEANDWAIKTYDDGFVIFSKFSPAGQDFFIEAELPDNLEDLYDDIMERYECYDPSEEAYLWLDNTGHGKNGAPYEMGDVYNDMVTCGNYIHELACLISEYC